MERKCTNESLARLLGTLRNMDNLRCYMGDNLQENRIFLSLGGGGWFESDLHVFAPCSIIPR